jgi:hypothetical protein
MIRSFFWLRSEESIKQEGYRIKKINWGSEQEDNGGLLKEKGG